MPTLQKQLAFTYKTNVYQLNRAALQIQHHFFRVKNRSSMIETVKFNLTEEECLTTMTDDQQVVVIHAPAF
jgi:hypothetical protein